MPATRLAPFGTAPRAPGIGMPSVNIAWSMVRGRSRHDSLCSCDGFRGEHPFASVAVVAEGTGGDRRSAEIAVSIIRDVFAEGVAFRVCEALLEAFHEAGERIRSEELRGCSATAVALLGREAWIVHAGGCRAYTCGPSGARALTVEHTLAGEMGLTPGDPGYRQRVADLTLQLGQKDMKPQTLTLSLPEGEGVVLASSAAWRHLQAARMPALLAARGGLHSGLEALLRESRVRFRRQGGAVAAVVPETQQGMLGSRAGKPLRLLALLALLGAALAAVFVRPSCDREAHGPGPVPGADTSATAIGIQPLAQAPDSAAHDTGPSPALPIRALVLGGGPVPAGPDTLSSFSAPLPDSLYEHIPPGVYFVAQDSLVEPLADALAAVSGFDSATAVDRIIVVREADVPAFAAWLSSLPGETASASVVVVETRSSVAGGAPWIRSFAIYANGDRSRSQEPSCYSGIAAEGLPATVADSCYRLVIAR